LANRAIKPVRIGYTKRLGLFIQPRTGPVLPVEALSIFSVNKILHLFFVDDVLIMSRTSLQEWKEIAGLLLVFIRASILEINLTKSTFHYSGFQGNLLEKFKELFPYIFMDFGIWATI
jgi:hypothetical protein